MSRLLELAQEAEQALLGGNAVDVTKMLRNYAELIVKECAGICDRLEDEYLKESDDAHEPDTIHIGVGAGICCTAILEHFGTEL